MPPRSRPLAPMLLALGLLTASNATAADSDPWAAVTGVREAMEGAGAERWDFRQTYVPAGFSSGETEGGTVFVGLPECVRWDYAEPYPKSFLLCGNELRAWTRGEAVGQLYSLDDRQPGLDLLLLDAGALASRYHAEIERLPNGATAVALTPKAGIEGALRDARLVITPDGRRLAELAYRDPEGNLTTFAFSEPARLEPGDTFVAPAGVRWERGSWGEPPGG